MNTGNQQNSSKFQDTLKTVESLSAEEQSLLIEVIQKRLQQKQNKEKKSDAQHSEGFKAYLASKKERYEVYRNLADS